MFLGKYFFDSYLQTFTEANPGYGINVTQEDIGNSSVVVLNTRFMNLYLPGIK
jgi:hypothetical protein